MSWSPGNFFKLLEYCTFEQQLILSKHIFYCIAGIWDTSLPHVQYACELLTSDIYKDMRFLQIPKFANTTTLVAHKFLLKI